MKLRYLLDFHITMNCSSECLSLMNFRWKVQTLQQQVNVNVYCDVLHDKFWAQVWSVGRYPQLLHTTARSTLRETFRDLLTFSKVNEI
jgi:hypothetical protein